MQYIYSRSCFQLKVTSIVSSHPFYRGIMEILKQTKKFEGVNGFVLSSKSKIIARPFKFL